VSVYLEVLSGGWAVVREALQASEVAVARETALRYLRDGGISLGSGRVQPAAAYHVPDLTWLFAHPRIIATAREALDADEIVFTGHSDLHFEHRASWHKDSGSAALGDPLCAYLPTTATVEDAFQGPAEVVKIGTYFQATTGNRSLRVDPGSHRRGDMEVQLPHAVPMAAGDLVVFDVRLTHAGQEPGSSAEAPSDPPRVAIFVTFGRPGATVAHFARVNMQRQLAQIGAAPGQFLRPPESFVRALRQAGVRLAPAVLGAGGQDEDST